MPELKTIKLLVIDDEEGMRAGVARALRDYNHDLHELDLRLSFQVDQAPDAESARDRIRAGSPDLILLDHKLPGVSGLDLLAELGGQQQDFLVIIITAYASIEMAVSATKRGAYDLLAKPFTPIELKAALARAAHHLIALRQARQLAEERRRLRFEFLSVLAHELKAPLAAVHSYLEVLREVGSADDPAQTARVIERAQARVSGMQKLIVDLLDLTRIESGQKRRTIQPVDLVGLARRSLETLANEAAQANLTLALDAPATAKIQADPDEIEIILNNLISNAIKYNRPGGRVDIRLTLGDRESTIEVADTGIGMSAEEIGRLFQEFVRIRNARTEWIIGSGLGLSIVDKLVHLYGGRIEVASREDEGSTFRVHLPVERG